MVKKLLTITLGLAMAFGALAQPSSHTDNQKSGRTKDITFWEGDIEFWVGTGSNTSMVIIAWDENPPSGDFALVWGVRWSGNVTALSLLDSITTYDSRLTYRFLTAQGANYMDDILYNDGALVGPSGSGWCYLHNNAWAQNPYNMESIEDGDIIEISSSCMFTLTEATAATNPNNDPNPPVNPVDATIAHSEILYWVGEGSNEALFIVSYAQPDTAFAWGYRFNSGATIQQMVNDIDAEDPRLEIVGNPSNGGDIHFALDNGDTLALSPVDPVRGYNFWWTNLNGLSVASMTTVLQNGDYFKYGDLNSATDWDFQYGYYMQEAWTKVPTPVSVPDTTTPGPGPEPQPEHGPFCGAVGTVGCDAIAADSSAIVAWATGCSLNLATQNIAIDGSPLVSYGNSLDAVGPCSMTDNLSVVSLGDGGSAILSFRHPIRNGLGPDFAVYENSFDDHFLELAFVEVSTDGEHFVRFPATSLTQTATQASSIDPTYINNLAGKYRYGYGTPFDLEELRDSTGIDIDSIVYVRVVDAVGSIDPLYATYDAYGHIVNDPWPTNSYSGGFDLDGVAVLYENITTHDGIDDVVNVVEHLWPNPATSHVNVQLSRPCEAVLYDLAGRKMVTFTLREGHNTLDLTNLNNGIYMLRTEGTVSKIVKK